MNIVNLLKQFEMNVILEKDKSNEESYTLLFPEAMEDGMFLIGKITNNELTIHERIGMNGTDIFLGNINTLSEDSLNEIKDRYELIKKCITNY